MCVYSMVMDFYADKWRWLQPPAPVVVPQPFPVAIPYPMSPYISPQEIEDFRKLLERAKEYDRKNNEPDCELEEKKKAIRIIAEKMGVKIDFL